MYRRLSIIALILAVAACENDRGLVVQGTNGEKSAKNKPMLVEFYVTTEWTGGAIPKIQTCRDEGGMGSTPPLSVKNIPEKTNILLLEINDLSEPYLAADGGLGVIGFYHDGTGETQLAPVPGETDKLPEFAFIHSGNKDVRHKVPGYMPPCSHGRGHLYAARVWAIHRTGARDTVLGIGDIRLGTH